MGAVRERADRAPGKRPLAGPEGGPDTRQKSLTAGLQGALAPRGKGAAKAPAVKLAPAAAARVKSETPATVASKGCPSCRFSSRGCARCKDPNYKPRLPRGPKSAKRTEGGDASRS